MSTPARPVSAWQRQGIATLVHTLRAGGFPIGASEASDATRLVIELAAREPGLDDAARLRTRLRPIFCKTREEQERFDPLFDEWVRRAVLTWERPEREPALATPPPVAEPAAPSRRSWLPIAAVVAVAIGLLAAAVAFWSRGASGPSTVAPAPPRPGQVAGGTTGPPATDPTLSGGAAAAPVLDRYVPAVRYNRELRAVWFWLLLALPVLPLFGVTLPAMVLSRTRLRRNPDPLVLDPRPLELEARRLVPSMPPDVSDRLARHVRSAGLDIDRLARRPVLDVRGTIEATIRNYGIPTLRFSHSRIHPSYLLLVDVANERDPRGRLFFQWAERLQREKLDVEMLLIRTGGDDGSKSVMFCPVGPTARDAAHWKPLARLRGPAFGERLMVISDGDPLVDAAGVWRPAALRARLYRWRDRVIFTPVEPRDWGVREEAIERKERAADPGFIVLPLEESALSAWADLVLTGQLSMMELSDPQRFPAMLRHGSLDRYVREEPPPAEQIEKLIAQLRIYLGTWGFEWLAACAVPPLVRWELTLLLGQDVMKGLPAPLTERDVNEALARNYRRLVRLPWMQQETMPQWLRLRLLAELPASRHRQLQRLVRDRLGALSPYPVTDGIVLNFERPPGERSDVGWRDDRPADRPDRRWEGDPLYLGYISGLTPEQLLLRAPREWSRWARKIRMRRPPGVRGWMARLRDRSASWWARLAWRDGLPHLGLNRRTMAIASMLPAPLVVLLVAASQWSLDADLRFADGWLFVEKPRLVAWPDSNARVFAVAFSPDGTRIAAAGESGIRVFDARTAVTTHTLIAEAVDWVVSIAFSPDGQWLAAGSENGALRLWDLRTGVAIARTGAHSAAVASIAFNHDGTRMASGSHDGNVLLWDAAQWSGTALWDHDGPLTSVAFSRDGKWLVSGGEDGRLMLFPEGTATGPKRELVADDTAPIVSVAFSSDGRLLIYGTRDGALRVLDASTWQLVNESRQARGLRTIAFSLDGRRLVSAGDDGSLRLWDPQLSAPIGGPLRGHDGVVWGVAFNRDGTRLVSGGDDGLRVWEARAVEPIGEPWQGHAELIRSVAFSPDGTRVVSGSANFDSGRGSGTLRLWDARTGKPLGEPLQGPSGGVPSVAFSPDGTRIASSDAENRVRLWDAVTGSPISELLAGHQNVVHAVAFSPDGAQLASAGYGDSTVLLWDARTGGRLGELIDRENPFLVSVAFSPDGTQLASSGFGGIRLWDMRTKQLLPVRFTGHTENAVWSVAFSPDGTRLASGGTDRTVRLWDVRTGAAIGAALPGHTSTVATVRFSPDGTRLASSDDSTLRLWDASTGAPIGSPVRSPDGPIRTIAFAPDGRYLAAAIGGTGATAVAPQPQPQQPPVTQTPASQEQRQQIERLRQIELRRQEQMRAGRFREASPPVSQPAAPPAPQPSGSNTGPHVIQLYRVDPWPVPDPERTASRAHADIAAWLTPADGQAFVVGAAVIGAVLLITRARLRRRRATLREIAAADALT